MKIGFIGGGNMGEAMLYAILSKTVATAGDITVADASPDRRQHLGREYGVRITASNPEAAGDADVVLMVVKPQSLAEVMAGMSSRVKDNQLVLSVVAGASTARLSQGLSHKAIVRAMPNTPAQIGQGITVWTATAGVSSQQKEQAAAILGAMGREIYMADENFLDMATAVSGSGPAYVFLFMEALLAAAIDIGLPPETAKQLVLETVAGSAAFAEKSGKELSELKRMVTSPGGTTAAALEVLDEGRFAELIKKAVAAAHHRAGQLGG
jgi:pyrroline-5-carboxylate reductase